MQMFTRRPGADAAIVRLRQEGKKAREIMQLLNVSCSRVTRVLIENGLSKPRPTAGKRAEVFALREQGMSLRKIAAKMGVTHNAIHQMLQRGIARTKMPSRVEVRDGIAYVTLTRGYVAKIDVADVPLVADRRWQAQVTKSGGVYAIAQKDGHRVLMHRLIMGNPPDKLVDHKHHDTLDNRRSELCVTDHAGNGHNARRSVNTGLPRLIRRTRYGKLFAEVTASTKSFEPDRLDEVIAARDELLRRIHGAGAVMTEKFMPVDVDPDTGEILDG